MRGKRGDGSSSRRAGRIIPAHAGQTWFKAGDAINSPDHPRACGANKHDARSSLPLAGSSPRMRGKPMVERIHIDFPRIIPAHAGQTECSRPRPRYRSDHPRACGANPVRRPRRRHSSGSSPRMRGKQSDFMRKLLSAGPSIIGFAQWLQSSYYCSCLQSSAKTPISRGTTPTSLFLGFQNSITLLLLT